MPIKKKSSMSNVFNEGLAVKDDFILVDQTINNQGHKGPLSRAEEFENFKCEKGLDQNRALMDNKGKADCMYLKVKEF